MNPYMLLEKLGEVSGSPRLSDRMNVAYTEARRKEVSCANLLRGACDTLRVSLSKKHRLTAELEAVGEEGGAMRDLQNMKEIMVRDVITLGALEQLLARAHVGVGMKDDYLANVDNTP